MKAVCHVIPRLKYRDTPREQAPATAAATLDAAEPACK
jgi:hypothetical protein